MTAVVLRGDAAHLPLPDESVDLIVTSPPYFGLRSYTDGGVHYAGQVGDEATPAEYLDALTACTREWVRVLKPGGSIFVNLGDKYSGAQQQNSGRQSAEASSDYWRRTDPKRTGIPNKSLMLLPQRYALRCVDDLGLILRAEIIWSKPNGLPSSVQDRVNRSHEQVFHLTKSARYYSAVDEVREETSRLGLSWEQRKAGLGRSYSPDNGHNSGGPGMAANPLGKLPSSVWTIPTAPLTVPAHLGVDHFAAFPPELVRRIVLGWSPREVCSGCGEGRRPVAQSVKVTSRPGINLSRRGAPILDHNGNQDREGRAGDYLRTVTGYACACREFSGSFPRPESTPGLVVDPFGGTGTTALVASVYGRIGLTVDLSLDYCRLARWRTSDPGERARALGVPKPEPVPDAQLGLFDGLGA